MDSVYMDKAYEQAKKSICMRAHVGCVIVRDNEIIAQGYNNVVGGIRPCREIGCLRDKLKIKSGTRREICRNICAEQLAITEAARNGVALDGSVAYITTYPCHICAKLLVSSGIREIVYDNEYPDTLSKDFLDEAGVIIRKLN